MRICSANSLVGVSIKDVGLLLLARSVLAKSGNPNASVLPEPVGALQQTSRPWIESGIDSL